MCVMAAHKPDPDPETPEKATRRKFPTKYKLKILAELDKAGPNQIGVIQRREGLYSSVVSTWKRQRDDGTLTTLAPKKRGRKPTKDPMDKENERLRRRVAQLEHKLETAELIIDVQKKVARLLELPQATPERSEKS
jgi:transposase